MTSIEERVEGESPETPNKKSESAICEKAEKAQSFWGEIKVREKSVHGLERAENKQDQGCLCEKH